MLDFFILHFRLRGDGRKSQVAVVGRAAEDHFRQCGKRDFLVQEESMRLEKLVLADIPAEDVVGG